MKRVNILGVGISAVNMQQALSHCNDVISRKGREYICVTGVHGIMEAQSDDHFRSILNQSFLCVPDGMPTVWVGRARGHRHMQRVYGPEFMLNLCNQSVSRGYRHFLYGGNDGVAEELAAELCRRMPGLQIVGTYTPPFRQLNTSEIQDLEVRIRNCKPHILWVGLSTPKQERFMRTYFNRLDTNLMIGVGAAFDIHIGRVKDAPSWMKVAGLQWVHRLIQEPRRLWKRYLINNPKFMLRILFQLTGLVNYSLQRPTIEL